VGEPVDTDGGVPELRVGVGVCEPTADKTSPDAGAPFEMYRELAFDVVDFLFEYVNALRKVFEECRYDDVRQRRYDDVLYSFCRSAAGLLSARCRCKSAKNSWNPPRTRRSGP